MAQEIESRGVFGIRREDMILVTGATGFVGLSLIARLAREGVETRACVRSDDVAMPQGVEKLRVGSLAADTDWSRALVGGRVMVHAAARVHMMEDRGSDPLAEFRRVNVRGSLNLARQAAAAGLQRFVFVSSIKVNGEGTKSGRPFSADDIAAPLDPYGISKMEAGQGLQEIAA